jgi:FkbH-like protein
MTLKLIEALNVIRMPAPDSAQRFQAALVCGCTPLHLKTLFGAYLRLRSPTKQTEIETGLLGDFAGNLDRASGGNFDAVAIIAEWQDFDARLGFRSLGSWSPDSFSSIGDEVDSSCANLERAIGRLANEAPVVFCAPTLPFPPVSSTNGWQASGVEVQIRLRVLQMVCTVGAIPGVRLVNQQYFDVRSPLDQRYDVDSDLQFGFPYRLGHASLIAEAMCRLMVPDAPKKGIITDLDDTLWMGILGEDGVDGVSWNLESGSQMHGAYQRLLQALADTGILIAIASKNDGALVHEALQRKDLLVQVDSVYPVQAQWQPKSESVGKILSAWNVSASDVAFIDDNPMELAEVKSAYPEIETLLFPRDDNAKILDLLVRLRELFGKSTISEEDRIRMQSLRESPVLAMQAGRTGRDEDAFLANAEAELTLDFAISPTHPRVVELVNKTNQFNLNGKRHGESAWDQYFKNPRSFLVVAEYKDKFGPLGKIAVTAGRKQGQVLCIDTWVMSCRAFSRRIEYGHLVELLRKFDADEVEFDYQPTPRNRPFLDFLMTVSGEEPRGRIRLTAQAILERKPRTFYQFKEARADDVQLNDGRGAANG